MLVTSFAQINLDFHATFLLLLVQRHLLFLDSKGKSFNTVSAADYEMLLSRPTFILFLGISRLLCIEILRIHVTG